MSYDDENKMKRKNVFFRLGFLFFNVISHWLGASLKSSLHTSTPIILYVCVQPGQVSLLTAQGITRWWLLECTEQETWYFLLTNIHYSHNLSFKPTCFQIFIRASIFEIHFIAVWIIGRLKNLWWMRSYILKYFRHRCYRETPDFIGFGSNAYFSKRFVRRQ